jgi:hypothetical protein
MRSNTIEILLIRIEVCDRSQFLAALRDVPVCHGWFRVAQSKSFVAASAVAV